MLDLLIFETKSNFQVKSILSLLSLPCQSSKSQNCAIYALRMIVQYLKNCKLCKMCNICPQTVKLEEMEKKAGNAEGDVSSLRFEITFINCLFPEHNSFFWKFPIEFFHLMTFGHIWITAGEAFDDQDCSELYVQVPPYPASGEQWETRRPPRKG